LSIGVPHADIGDATVNDAEAVANLFASNKDSLKKNIYREVEIITLTKNATAGQIELKLKAITSSYNNNELVYGDHVLIYISSHGYQDTNKIRIQGQGWNVGIRDRESIKYEDDILKNLENLPLRKIILLDICRNNFNKSEIVFPKFETGVTAISSSSSGQKSVTNKIEPRMSVFTRAFIDGMRGGADKDKNRKIGLDELYKYLCENVPRLSDDIETGHIQNPDRISGELGNLIIFQY
jgi:hypothetical protein